MARHLDNRLWLLLVALAIALTAACSSSTSPGGDGGEDAPVSMTGG